MNRKEIKRQRLRLLHEQEQLEAKRCEHCAGNPTTSSLRLCYCPAAIRIREIGEELNRLSREKQKPPQKLNLEAYNLLKSWEWENQQIRKHYGISQQDFTFWMRSNGLLRNKKEGPKVVAKANDKLTVELYMDLKAKGLSDINIGKDFNMKPHQIQYWRKQNGLTSVRDIKQKRMEAIVGETKVEQESEPVVKTEEQQVHEFIKKAEESGVKLATDMSDAAAEISRLKKELQDRKYEIDLLKIGKVENEERIRVLQAESTDYKTLQQDYLELQRNFENLSQEHNREREKAEKADEIALEAADWRKKYENEHLRFLEANAVIMEYRETIRTMNDAWDDDTEETKGELRQLREQNAYLKAEVQNMKKVQGIHDEFKNTAMKQIEKKNKLIYAFMEYHREEA